MKPGCRLCHSMVRLLAGMACPPRSPFIRTHITQTFPLFAEYHAPKAWDGCLIFGKQRKCLGDVSAYEWRTRWARHSREETDHAVAESASRLHQRPASVLVVSLDPDAGGGLAPALRGVRVRAS